MLRIVAPPRFAICAQVHKLIGNTSFICWTRSQKINDFGAKVPRTSTLFKAKTEAQTHTFRKKALSNAYLLQMPSDRIQCRRLAEFQEAQTDRQADRQTNAVRGGDTGKRKTPEVDQDLLALLQRKGLGDYMNLLQEKGVDTYQDWNSR